MVIFRAQVKSLPCARENQRIIPHRRDKPRRDNLQPLQRQQRQLQASHRKDNSALQPENKQTAQPLQLSKRRAIRRRAEPFDDYTERVRETAKLCQIGESEDTEIADQIIQLCRSEKTKVSLFPIRERSHAKRRHKPRSNRRIDL